jgi:heterodisulfide reductase subunit A
VSDNSKIGAVMVIGGGIGGMQAALDLAEGGYKVYLLDRAPSIGGTMAKLDKTFPTQDCAMCTIAPRLVGTARHHNIEMLTYSELVSVEGEAGRFGVTIKKKTRYIDESKCTGCGLCAQHCPVEAIDEYNYGLTTRAPIYLSFPQASPRVFTIDRNRCIGCGICATACGPGAVNYALRDEIRDLDVGAIVVAAGADLFDPSAQAEYGYGRYPNVVTGLEFERILSPSGPYRGMVLRPYDGREPRNIAFIQCVGSRREDRNWCSAVCCMYATKQCIVAMEHAHGLQCTVFFIDFRAFSKGFDAYYERAKKAGVRYIRALPSSIKEASQTRNLNIQYVPPGNGNPVVEEFDLVVLSCGLQPPKGNKELAEKLGIELTPDGFCRTPPSSPLETTREGIYVCGPFVEPKDIPETVTQASGAAAKAMALLADVRGTRVTPKVYPSEIEITGQEPRIGVFVCHCGTNIASVVDVADVAEYAKTLPNVVHAEHNLFTCSTDTQENIKRKIKELSLNRVVVASCTPRTHEPLFQNTIREAGLNFYLFEMANIRDQCSWVHMHEHAAATRKARDLVRMAVAKVRLMEPLYRRTLELNHDALVIGGGLAGMTAALELARQGIRVYLVERESELGGNMRRLHFLLDSQDPHQLLRSTIGEVRANKNIHVFTNAEVAEFEGSLGRFKTTVSVSNVPNVPNVPNTPNAPGEQLTLQHGVVIVATGAEQYQPTEYLYGNDSRVITQFELEEWLSQSVNQSTSQLVNPSISQLGKASSQRVDYSLVDQLTNHRLTNVVMIQCVGSRCPERPYCSRVCCGQAIKNSLKIKELSPETEVHVLYRDVRAYGFIEAYYRKAREAGVIFQRYEDEQKPAVSNGNGRLKVTFTDAMLGKETTLESDLLVLSAATVPRSDADQLAQKLKVPLTQERFFLEAHMKLNPVDFATEGIFLCGMAHYPKTVVTETISQACAVAARAAAILSKPVIELEPTISHIVEERCDGCAYCVDPCPFKAITLIQYSVNGEIKKRAQIDESACKGCGTCQATCPKDAVFVSHFKLAQLRAMVMAAVGK